MASGSSNRVLVGVLAILFGGLGIHRFILGDVMGGIIRLILGCFGIGAIIGIIEGIIYLTKSDEEFERVYVQEKRAWF